MVKLLPISHFSPEGALVDLSYMPEQQAWVEKSAPVQSRKYRCERTLCTLNKPDQIENTIVIAPRTENALGRGYALSDWCVCTENEDTRYEIKILNYPPTTRFFSRPLSPKYVTHTSQAEEVSLSESSFTVRFPASSGSLSYDPTFELVLTPESDKTDFWRTMWFKVLVVVAGALVREMLDVCV